MNEVHFFALPFAFIAIFLLAFVWPTWRTWRTTRVNPIVLPSSDDAYGYVAKGFKVCLLALLAYTIVQVFLPTIRTMGALPALSAPLLGWVSLGVATGWIVFAQGQMGASWRVGIDTQRATKLVTHGVFSISRNPIFLGMRLSLAALVMLQSNVFTLCFALLGEVLMQVQVRLEESHLKELHRAAYFDYQKSVRRWL